MSIVEPIKVVEESLLPGTNVLIEGGGGTGKTHCLGTIADAGVELFYIDYENGLESLLGYWTDRGKPIPPNVHWHKVPSNPSGFGLLNSSAIDLNTLVYKSLLEKIDPKRGEYKQYFKFLEAMSNFTDQRTGESFGPIDKWGPNRVLAIDGLTGLTKSVTELRIGGAAVKTQSDIYMIQGQIEKTLRQLTDGCPCHFVLISHIEVETIPLLGARITVSTIGKALAPIIPPMFSDVILCTREQAKWTWSTANSQTDLKTRNLPIQDGLTPDFAQIFTRWKQRGGKLAEKVKSR